MVERRVGFSFPSLSAIDDLLRERADLYERRIDVYQRFFNRTIDDTEVQLAAIEGARWALLAPSGMAAVDLAIATLSPSRAHWVIPDCVYPGTRSYAEEVLRVEREWTITWLPIRNGAPDWRLFDDVLERRPTGLFLEVIANPIAFRLPAESLTERALRSGVRVVVDNTLATPAICRPLEWGGDLVVHSATKFLSGGSVLAGVVCGNCPTLRDRIRSLRRRTGNVVAPVIAGELVERVRDFPTRFRQQCRNATAVSALLAAHPEVERVVHPSLLEGVAPDAGGAVLTVWLGGATPGEAFERRDRFVAALGPPVCCSTSLGSPVTGILHLGALDPSASGIEAAAIRISAGVEAFEALRCSFERGLAALETSPKR